MLLYSIIYLPGWVVKIKILISQLWSEQILSQLYQRELIKKGLLKLYMLLSVSFLTLSIELQFRLQKSKQQPLQSSIDLAKRMWISYNLLFFNTVICSSTATISVNSIPKGYICLTLLSKDNSSIYLQISLDIINSLCLKPYKYLVFLIGVLL